MRAQSLAFGLATGAALFCLAAIGRAVGGHPEFAPGLLYVFGLGVGLGLAVMVWMDVADALADHAASREHTYAKADQLRAQAEIARSALDTPAVASQAPTTGLVGEIGLNHAPEIESKVKALDRFFRNGEAAGGFSYDKMSGAVGSTTLGRLHEFYCSDEGKRVLRMESGNTGTIWGYGWGLDLTLRELHAGRLPLPPGPAPEIEVFVQTAAKQNATRRSAKGVRVVENTPRS